MPIVSHQQLARLSQSGNKPFFNPLLLSANLTNPITSEPTKPTTQILQHLLERCSSISHLKQIHSQLTTRPTPCLLPALIRSYTSSGSLTNASLLFHRFPPLSSSPVLWNILIQAFSKTPNSHQSLLLFLRMLASHAIPDKYTFTFVIASCSRGSLSTTGETVHGRVIKTGFNSDLFVGNSLVNMYSEFTRLSDARRVFDEMPHRDVVSWTSLVGGCLKIGEIDIAQKLFERMPEPNDVSWAVLIAGYVRNGRYSDAVVKFHTMLISAEVKPNEAILVTVLSACSVIGALDQGKWIHAFIRRSRLPQSSNISTALIDMYSKCGSIDCAKQVFSSSERDVVTWTSMISGLAINGNGTDALKVFRQMLAEGFRPDNITLLGVLNACSHSGLVGVGCSIIYSMKRSWGIDPELGHYGCLIDLLGRAGQLEEAFEAVRNMPMEPDIVIWRALLSACRIHKDVNLGEKIMEKISQLDPSSQGGGGYVLLSNLYATVGRWDGVTRVRKTISKSSPGCSWIEINGVVHEFLAADRFHPEIKDIRNTLNEVLRRVRIEDGYVTNTENVLFDLSEEEKEQAVSWHSEKLAVAFGLMRVEQGNSIRIVKNLRICEDCHSAIKAIAKVFDREIVVRDRTRFHTFSEGKCSCSDYW